MFLYGEANIDDESPISFPNLGGVSSDPPPLNLVTVVKSYYARKRAVGYNAKHVRARARDGYSVVCVWLRD